MQVSLKNEIQEMDELIRQGKATVVRERLEAFDRRKKIPRADALAIAFLARRADLPALGLRVLSAYVLPSNKSAPTANEEEKAEYAFCLTKYGAFQEAIQLLGKLDAKKNPEVLLSHAFALVAQWKHGESIPFLKQYVEAPELSDYQRSIGYANLAAAYVAERSHGDAQTLLNRLIPELERNKMTFLHGRILSLAAQDALNRREWADAEKSLVSALKILKDVGGLEGFLLRKWSVFLKLLKEEASPASREALAKLQKEAIKMSHWETLRQCDMYEGIARHDPELMTHVYFGTPFESFRKKLLREIRQPLNLPESYLWIVNREEGAGKIVTLLADTPSEKGEFKFGGTLHRLLVALASDFYRPQSLTALHFALHPGDHFDPFSSGHKIHQALKRLRGFFAKSKIPLKVDESDGLYRLVSSKACSLLLPRAGLSGSRVDFLVKKLKDAYPEDAFSAKEASRCLGISRQSALTLLRDACDKQELERSGAGPKTKYSFG